MGCAATISGSSSTGCRARSADLERSDKYDYVERCVCCEMAAVRRGQGDKASNNNESGDGMESGSAGEGEWWGVGRGCWLLSEHALLPCFNCTALLGVG